MFKLSELPRSVKIYSNKNFNFLMYKALCDVRYLCSYKLLLYTWSLMLVFKLPKQYNYKTLYKSEQLLYLKCKIKVD